MKFRVFFGLLAASVGPRRVSASTVMVIMNIHVSLRYTGFKVQTPDLMPRKGGCLFDTWFTSDRY